ncbi:MAG: tRNA pseudouridine32 synthase/23S rRNA pseudouridine746 synthase [Pseudohongiellaceae bacterium]|jgi:tRNA pseudouridine32 synthase/23S rRNA pseudouridine746 synthase
MLDQKIETIYLDEHIRVIHKPINVCFHTDDQAPGIVGLVKASYPGETLYPIHRLDKITSGLMVFARSSEVNEVLSKMLQDKQIEKYYLALSKHKPSKKQGAVVGDMKKGRRGSYLLLREKTNPATTHFFAKSFVQDTQRYWFFVLKPETGKTHQLRVAMKSLASPVLGDRRYEQVLEQTADSNANEELAEFSKDGLEASEENGTSYPERSYLHAYKMRFDLFGKRYEIIDPSFEGNCFELKAHLNNADIETLLKPDELNWPKRAFKLQA